MNIYVGTQSKKSIMREGKGCHLRDLVCAQCGLKFVNHSKPAKNYFCSRSCYHQYSKGAGNPNWRGGGEKVNCKVCGDEFVIATAQLKHKGYGNTCSLKCRDELYRLRGKVTKEKRRVDITVKTMINSALKQGFNGRRSVNGSQKTGFYADNVTNRRKKRVGEKYKIGRSDRMMEVLGYTGIEIKEHLEGLFKEGMTWDNHGRWHIDHKIPKRSFDYKDIKDPGVRECWDLKNLQPIWADENLKKGSFLII